MWRVVFGGWLVRLIIRDKTVDMSGSIFKGLRCYTANYVVP